ncbi:hypothetical protein [Roseibium sp.]|uniref:hypothetical protein n=1 Tax=Roseibium sp. TaxID=1936156 RepID=UPI003263B9CF
MPNDTLLSIRQAPQLTSLEPLLNNKNKEHIKFDEDNNFKIGYSTVVGKIKYSNLSDKIREYSDGEQYTSIKAQHNQETIRVLMTKFSTAATNVMKSQLHDHYQELRNNDTAPQEQVHGKLSEDAEFDQGLSIAEGLMEEVTKLVGQRLNIDGLTGVKRVTIGQVRDLIPEIDQLVSETVENEVAKLVAKLSEQ